MDSWTDLFAFTASIDLAPAYINDESKGVSDI